ncbi:MAG TPA: kelch repeat-containing protein, partial [Candidatus Acidoferrales bacterium]|nr:kelch repeat-containing protein [Candidatus Acidoferrales bacterium]
MKRNALIFSFLLAFLLMPSFVDVTALASGATSENTWEIKTAIPIPEGVKKAAAVNGLIYVLGGSTNYEYNPSIDNWTIKAPMPTPRWHFGIAVNEDKIYTFGGWEASEVEVYNPASDTWETKTPLPSIITNPQANVIDNKIYVMSMEGSYCYNIANDSWSTISNAPYGSSQVAMDGRIYAFYGSHTNIYDPMSDSWREGAPMPVTIYQPSVCATTGIMAPKKIYLFGGIEQTFDSGTTFVQVYDPESDSWTLGNTMPMGRSSSAITVVNDQIYVIGGSTGMYSV